MSGANGRPISGPVSGESKNADGHDQSSDFDRDGVVFEGLIAGQPADKAIVQREQAPGLDPVNPVRVPMGVGLDLVIRHTQSFGLLSLAIDFVPPASSREKTFHYVGADTSITGIPLEVDYVDRRSGSALRLFVIAPVPGEGRGQMLRATRDVVSIEGSDEAPNAGHAVRRPPHPSGSLCRLAVGSEAHA